MQSLENQGLTIGSLLCLRAGRKDLQHELTHVNDDGGFGMAKLLPDGARGSDITIVAPNDVTLYTVLDAKMRVKLAEKMPRPSVATS